MYVHTEYFFSSRIHGYAFCCIPVALFLERGFCAWIVCIDLIYIVTCTRDFIYTLYINIVKLEFSYSEVKAEDPAV